jgi:hypothetical protein
MGVAAMAADRGGREAAFCDLSHGTSAPGSESGKTPAGRHGHHSDCTLCPTAFCAAPLASTPVWAALLMAGGIQPCLSGLLTKHRGGGKPLNY